MRALGCSQGPPLPKGLKLRSEGVLFTRMFGSVRTALE